LTETRLARGLRLLERAFSSKPVLCFNNSMMLCTARALLGVVL
jgi:hypothetical protein